MAATEFLQFSGSCDLLADIPSYNQVLTIFMWVGIVTVLAIAGLYFAIAFRRWSQREDRSETFTVQDLRDLRARGEITEEEFTAMRAALLAQVRADAHPDSAAAAENAASREAPAGAAGPGDTSDTPDEPTGEWPGPADDSAPPDEPSPPV